MHSLKLYARVTACNIYNVLLSRSVHVFSAWIPQHRCDFYYFMSVFKCFIYLFAGSLTPSSAVLGLLVILTVVFNAS